MAELPPPEFTFEQASEAFDRVKAEFETDVGRLAVIPEDRYEDVYTIMREHFIPDEPLSKAFGVMWNEVYRDLIHFVLRENVSVMIVSKETGEMMGVRLNAKMRKDDAMEYALAKMAEHKQLLDLVQFVMHKDEEADFYGRFGVQEAMHFVALGVHKKFRRMGLGAKLMQACVAFSKELGYKAIKGEGTSNYSQRIYDKCGFDNFFKIPYDSYIYNGKTIRESTGEHTMMKLYGLKL